MSDRPVTAAFEELDRLDVQYEAVSYGEVRSATEAASARGVDVEALAKTLVLRLGPEEHVLALVPGNMALDYPKMRAFLGVRKLSMPDPTEAERVTGYARGTITPFGAGDHRIVVDRRLFTQALISLGSGARGWAIHLDPAVLLRFGAESADITG